jgi:CHAD domain-containing protein
MKATQITRYAEQQTRARLKVLGRRVEGAAKHPSDPDSIHDLRVAIRRFTQCLRTFENLFDRKDAKSIRRRLTKLMDRCGAVRNCDVTMELLKEAGAGGRGAVSHLRRVRAESQEELSRELNRRRKRKTVSGFTRKLRLDPSGKSEWDAHQDVPHNARQVLPKVAAQFFKSGGRATAAGAKYPALHAFRLAAKRFRYTLEIFQRFYGDQVDTGLESLRGLQERLGAINDCVTARVLLEKHPQARAAVEQLLPAREGELRDYWRHEFNPRKQKWWVDWLGGTEKAETKALKKHGPVSVKARRSAAA